MFYSVTPWLLIGEKVRNSRSQKCRIISGYLSIELRTSCFGKLSTTLIDTSVSSSLGYQKDKYPKKKIYYVVNSCLSFELEVSRVTRENFALLESMKQPLQNDTYLILFTVNACRLFGALSEDAGFNITAQFQREISAAIQQLDKQKNPAAGDPIRSVVHRAHSHQVTADSCC